MKVTFKLINTLFAIVMLASLFACAPAATAVPATAVLQRQKHPLQPRLPLQQKPHPRLRRLPN